MRNLLPVCFGRVAIALTTLSALGCAATTAAGSVGAEPLIIAAAAASLGVQPTAPAPQSPPTPSTPRTPGTPGATETAQPFEYFSGLRFDASVPSPSQFLGYEIGERFTQHHDVIAYVKALATASPRAMYQQYGQTHEGRALSLLTISSPENIAHLDDILARNLELTDPRKTSSARAKQIIDANPAIVWLSYNVHGNEASSSEAALRVAYTMTAATNREITDILKNVVLVIDPMINPDGRERYVSWFRTAMGKSPNASKDAAEHDEPWPGGRTNHYYFDLNRDWLWMVHPESQARIRAYKKVMPQLHVDYHEQGYRSPYFFGAGDDPYNANIPDATRDWINKYGEANAKVFDKHGLVYATRERFDYLYPGYGKVLPVYHGAVGLLCEQGGHGFAGRAVQVEGNYILTLRERARHHFLTSMSYLETTAANRTGQLERFHHYFRDSLVFSDDSDRAFILSADNDPALLDKVWRLCAAHKIEIETTARDMPSRALRSYKTGQTLAETTIPAGSWVIRADQPMGRLARAIFERSTFVSSNETYDITGWSIPVVFGLDAWFTKAEFTAATKLLTSFTPSQGAVTGAGDYAIVIDARQRHFPIAVGLAVKHGILTRRAGADIEINGQQFSMGSLIVHTVRNKKPAIEAFLADVTAAGLRAARVDSGLTTKGPVLGTNENGLLTLPRVLLVRGEGISGNSFGQHWHLLDVESPIPYTAVNVASLASVKLDTYNVIVLPSTMGSFTNTLGDVGLERLKAWVRDGGTLIASANSAQWASKAILGLEPKPDIENNTGEPALNALTWKERKDRNIEDKVPGALLRIDIDTTHPLAAGVRDWMGVLKFGGEALPVGERGYVVARFASPDPRIGGVLADRVRDELAGKPFMTHHRLGAGNVICFADDETFRGFLHAPMRLLLNAIVFGPSL